MVSPHPSALRRNVLWLMSTVTVLVLLFGYHTSTEGKSGVGIVAASGPTTQPTTQAATPSESDAATGSQSTSQSGSTTTVTGEVAQTQWGPVQVRLTMTGSTISAVDVLEYPNGNGRDAEINAYALPRLVQETITAQSAQIDMISGATVTSGGYIQSLQSALDKA